MVHSRFKSNFVGFNLKIIKLGDSTRDTKCFKLWGKIKIENKFDDNCLETYSDCESCTNIKEIAAKKRVNTE